MVLVNKQVIQLRGEKVEQVISTDAVVAVNSAERRSDDPSVVSAALGWGHVFRALKAEGQPVRVRTVTGSTVDGTVDVVGADFVRVHEDSGRDQMLPFAALAIVSGRT